MNPPGTSGCSQNASESQNHLGLERSKSRSPFFRSLLVKRISQRATETGSAPNFLLRLMAKDLRYAINEGAQRGVALQTAASALAVFEHAVSQGRGEGDLSAVVGSLH
jgi:3-hydroxyisobutyrate dehydrogenase-like beta-hydroxyacid dehydrogenase